MNLAGLREANISGGRSRRIHTGTYLASFSQQRRAGWGTEAQAMIPRTSRGLAALQLCWEGHFEAAVEIEVPNTAKAKTTAQRHAEPISSVQFSSVAQSCDSLRPHELQHARPPCPSPTGVHPNSPPSSRWYPQPSHPLLSPSPAAPNPSRHQGLFQWVNSSHEVAKVLEFQL